MRIGMGLISSGEYSSWLDSVPEAQRTPQCIMGGNCGPIAAPAGATSSAPNPLAQFTLVNGKMISDPATQLPTREDCVPYMCGADPGNQQARLWCAQHGFVGALTCTDPQCQPYRSAIPACTLPQVYGAALAPPQIVTLTPQNIVQPLPDITSVTAPTPAPQGAPCSFWCDLNRAISEHPLVAVLLLGLAGAACWSGKHGR